MLFKLEDFIAAPSQELLNLAKKSDLLDIASRHGAITGVSVMIKLQLLGCQYD